MADKNGATANSKLMVRKKERTTKTAVEIKKEVKTEMNGEVPMEEGATANKDMANGAVEAHGADGEYETIELPPCEIMEGYMSSSPCAACAAKITEALRAGKTIKMTLFSARLFEWEEQEIQAGCKLRMMKPMDFTYVWDTFVENDDLTFTPLEDCQDNDEYYHEKLAEIMQ
ncbi:C-_U-editing enzyme APOBEC-2-like [Oncorhynchus masou masou]|uniref:C->U-editing enzyme APOBEC-2-like n=1 Tax=Oncorhynchus masou masou TaxID=90313 RepID=UPI003183B02A